jgi:hypothetical protein
LAVETDGTDTGDAWYVVSRTLRMPYSTVKKHARAMDYEPPRRTRPSLPKEVMVGEEANEAMSRPEQVPGAKRNFYRPELPSLAELPTRLQAGQDDRKDGSKYPHGCAGEPISPKKQRS